ncbi:MAG: hypothetical protein JRG96_05150 [Deltaproteobacteria bacterium]|nr:hypothetical protein [Deltaproteobacteria bacterium]MBW2418498.1 hypothetical protein [Deltaproteobacteria bacterium]
MTEPGSRGEEDASGPEGEGAPDPSSTPLLPALGRGGPRWIAFAGLLVAVAAVVWRCA